MRNGCLIVFFLFFHLFVSSQMVVSLYEGDVPGSLIHEDTEYCENGIIYEVSNPGLEIYLPQNEKAGKTAIVICPGGGYGSLYFQRCRQMALTMNSNGIAAFVLKYRLPNDRTCSKKELTPLQDAQKAIKVVRENADKWGVDKSKVGIMGFSAGGHLASLAGTHFKEDYIDNRQGTSLRPDFMILIYPLISMQCGLADPTSRKNLLGTSPDRDMVYFLSSEQQVSGNMPSAFLMHALDDSVVPVKNSILFYEAMKTHNVPVDIHLFQKGEHGFTLEPARSDWQGNVFRWMREQGMMPE